MEDRYFWALEHDWEDEEEEEDERDGDEEE